MKSFFFYDLETTGLNARTHRIMQFAGQRTNLDLEPIGDPVNVLVRLTDDILPDPGAIMVTGITPQQTLSDGMGEVEFCRLLLSDIFTPDTITLGFNSIRFDDEFIRHTLWRNFYDPYEWGWSEGRSRWDMLDVIRMTRALRPEGIEWPVDATGKATNKLELIAAANGLVHTKAHDAMSDVEALIGVAELIRTKQPKLFDYLFAMREKKKVAELVNLENPVPFVYSSSGRYDAAYEKTTVAFPIAPGPMPGSVLVYDLRHDPTPLATATPRALSEIMFASREQRQDPEYQNLPVKTLAYNKSPAVAPLGVLDDAARERLGVSMEAIQQNLNRLAALPDFGAKVREAFEMREPFEPTNDVDQQLYDGFIPDKDKGKMATVRAADANDLADFDPHFIDGRLNELLVRYKARQFPASLNDDERRRWEEYRAQKLRVELPKYLETLQGLAGRGADTFLLEELQLWAESIVPED